jgi:dihydrodipicolinate synthase/N-acetylneuraminate lyase
MPIDDHDHIEFSRQEDELDYLLASGVDGIYTKGTAGEFYAQTRG